MLNDFHLHYNTSILIALLRMTVKSDNAKELL